MSQSLMSSILTQPTQLTGTTCHLLHLLELIMIVSTQCYLDVTYFQRKTKTLYIWFGDLIATYVSSCFKSNYYYSQCPAIQDAVKEKSFRILIIVIFFGILWKESLRNLEHSHNTKQQRRCWRESCMKLWIHRNFWIWRDLEQDG